MWCLKQQQQRQKLHHTQSGNFLAILCCSCSASWSDVAGTFNMSININNAYAMFSSFFPDWINYESRKLKFYPFFSVAKKKAASPDRCEGWMKFLLWIRNVCPDQIENLLSKLITIHTHTHRNDKNPFR